MSVRAKLHMAVADREYTDRLQGGAVSNAVESSDEPFSLQSLCMNCYENVSTSSLCLPYLT